MRKTLFIVLGSIAGAVAVGGLGVAAYMKYQKPAGYRTPKPLVRMRGLGEGGRQLELRWK